MRIALRVAAAVGLMLVLATGASAFRSADEWSVSISADSSVAPGGQYKVTASVTYTYATWNDNVTLSVSSPLAASYVGNDDPADCNSASCTFHFLSGTKTVTYTFTAPSTSGTSLGSTASSSNGFEPNPTPAPSSGTVYTVVSTPPPPVTISASTGASQVTQGGTISIAVSATNTGSTALSDIWVSNTSGLHWSAESMSQTGGPGFACDHPNAFDTNCSISSFPAGATATFTATETAADAAVGEILNARFSVTQGASPGGTALAGSVVSVQVVAAAATTTTGTTTAAPPPPATTTAPASTVTIATTTQATTTSPPPPPPPTLVLCIAPRLVGLSLAAARTAATRRHCRLTVTYLSRTSVRRGNVVRQRVPPGTRLVRGAAIAVVVSRRAGSRR